MRGGGVAHGRSVTNRSFRKGPGTPVAASASDNGSTGPRAVAGPEPVAVGAANGTAPGGREADLAATSAEMRVRARPGTARTWSASGWSRFVPTNWRVRWRLVAMVVVPAVTAAFLGGLTIDRDASGWLANGRVQNLAQLNLSVVRLSQALENERDLSAGYAANKTAISGLDTQLRLAQAATASAGQAVKAGAARIGTAGGYRQLSCRTSPGCSVILRNFRASARGCFHRRRQRCRRRRRTFSCSRARPSRLPTRSAPRPATAPATRT